MVVLWTPAPKEITGICPMNSELKEREPAIACHSERSEDSVSVALTHSYHVKACNAAGHRLNTLSDSSLRSKCHALFLPPTSSTNLGGIP